MTARLPLATAAEPYLTRAKDGRRGPERASRSRRLGFSGPQAAGFTRGNSVDFRRRVSAEKELIVNTLRKARSGLFFTANKHASKTKDVSSEWAKKQIKCICISSFLQNNSAKKCINQKNLAINLF